MRAQQPHVNMMRPAKAHRVNTNTVATHCGRLCIAFARRTMPHDPSEAPILQEETPSRRHDIPTGVLHEDTLLLTALQGAIDPSTQGMKDAKQRRGWPRYRSCEHMPRNPETLPPLGRKGLIKTRGHHARGPASCAARVVLSSRGCRDPATIAQQRQARAVRDPTPLMPIPQHYRQP